MIFKKNNMGKESDKERMKKNLKFSSHSKLDCIISEENSEFFSFFFTQYISYI